MHKEGAGMVCPDSASRYAPSVPPINSLCDMSYDAILSFGVAFVQRRKRATEYRLPNNPPIRPETHLLLIGVNAQMPIPFGSFHMSPFGR